MHTRVGRRTLARIKLDVHPSAHVHPSASLAHGVVIGPRAYVGPRAVLDAHVTAGADVAIGEATRVGAHTSLEHCTVGRRCVIHAGVRVGADGFGFALPDVPGQQPSKRPQMLRVLIGDDVELGAGTCVDRGSWRHTELGAGCKLDNQVQIGHNARLGTGCILCAQSAVAGSATLGDGCVLAGKAAVSDHVQIVAGVRLAACSAAMSSIREAGDYGGVPARAVRTWKHEVAAGRALAAEWSKRRREARRRRP